MTDTTLIQSEPKSHERPGPAYDVYLGDAHVGRVYRYRHTYRTKYAGSRIGYDRTHICWWGTAFGTGEADPYGESLRCYTSRKTVVDLIVTRAARR